MKAKLYAQIKISVEVRADFGNQIIPRGTLGTVVECYENPEAYAVDTAIPNERLVGGFKYENIILSLEQFAVVDTVLPTVNVVE